MVGRSVHLFTLRPSRLLLNAQTPLTRFFVQSVVQQIV